ncbi:MAG: Tex family protein [Planctomycetota bacterium]
MAKELGIAVKQVDAVVELLESGNTIPFIARYRKEATGSLDEVALRSIEDALERAKALAARKSTVLKTIEGQGMLTDSLRREIDSAGDLATLEAIYLPFKPKRRSRATVARERGLQPLADQIVAGELLQNNKQKTIDAFVDPGKDVPDRKTALAGALDIIAEQWADVASTRRWLVEQSSRFGEVTSKLKRGKKNDQLTPKFEQYLDRQESVRRIPGHRLLAMLRGQAEGILRIGVQLDESRVVSDLKSKLVPDRQHAFAKELLTTVEDCFDRLLMPATESSVLQTLKERADEEAIAVFGKNLNELLMAAPAGPRPTIGIDPGFRTGCKLAVVDQTGKYLEHATIHPTPPKSDVESAGKTLLRLIQKHDVELIAIGNGTASRETDAFVSDLIGANGLTVTKVMVSEAGASIYSASEIAAQEFPHLDVTIRGAISIARRLQDPLAELVKADPKSIGVGQYQHDVNQPRLRKCLDRTVESCVNKVGVDLNMASVPLLSYVAGIGPQLAKNIVRYRDENGGFRSRRDLSKVPKLGKKAFEQAAGFLRIVDGDEPLDNSAVHPECYPIVAKMGRHLRADSKSLVGNPGLGKKLDPNDFTDDQFGIPTVRDIIAELGKPGRDPRSEFRVVRFDESVQSVEDLKKGMILEGSVTNVTHFGAFVDLGVHQDGLIHISQLAERFVEDPAELVSVGDVVKVKVMEVDRDRNRIALTRKF